MSPTRLAPALCAAAMIATLAGSSSAQTVATVNLGKANAKSKYALGNLFSLQELPDGRVVATDTKEQVFRLVDFNKGEVGLVGKQGDEADSYRSASSIFRLGGDTLALFDSQGHKLMRVTPQGTVAGFIAVPSMMGTRRLGLPIAADRSGSLYFRAQETFADTATRTMSGVTTVNRLGIGADADEPQLSFRTRRADQVKPTGGAMPFIFADAIAIRNDGLIARVVSDTYQVVFGQNGKEISRTGPLPFTPVMLTVAESKAVKDSIIDWMKSMTAGVGRPAAGGDGAGGGRGSPMAATSMGGGGDRVVIMGGGGGGGGGMAMGMAGGSAFTMKMDSASAQGGRGATSVNTFNPADMKFGDFPAYKPPMAAQGNRTAMFDANGNLWVARSTTHSDNVLHYDVIAEGKGLIGRVNLPAGARLMGFGKNSLYLARTEDGSDWLERYAMPKL